jgi:hypothetical protein
MLRIIKTRIHKDMVKRAGRQYSIDAKQMTLVMATEIYMEAMDKALDFYLTN